MASSVQMIFLSTVFSFLWRLCGATNTTTCNFIISDINRIKQEFEQKTMVDNVEMIYFDIHITGENNKTIGDIQENTDDEDEGKKLHENGLTRWIWMLESNKYLLSYPIDFEAVTLGLANSVEQKISISQSSDKNLSDIYDNYENCVESVYQTIYSEVLNVNKTDWLFCHRSFTNQGSKKILYYFTGSWLGYDFECFDVFCKTLECTQPVKKGTINVVISVFVLVIACYLPLLLLLLPDRTMQPSNASSFYKKGEYPYTFKRLAKRASKFANMETTFGGTKITNCLPEIILVAAIYFAVLIMFLIQNVLIIKAIPDFFYFRDIYHPTYLLKPEFLSINESNLYLNLLLNFITFLLFTVCAPFLLLISILDYVQPEDGDSVCLKPWKLQSKITNENKDARGSASVQYLGYTQFGILFLNRISLFFSPRLWIDLFDPNEWTQYNTRCQLCLTYLGMFFIVPLTIVYYIVFLLLPIIPLIFHIIIKLPTRNLSKFQEILGLCFGIVCVFYICCLLFYFLLFFIPYIVFVIQFTFRTFVYTLFVAGPLFSSLGNSYDIWIIAITLTVYFLKYNINFKHHYKHLLNKLLQMQKDLTDAKLIHLQNKDMISVEIYDEIADTFLPVRKHVTMLMFKILFTGLFLFVSFNSINKGGNHDFFTKQIPIILTTILPALAEKLCSPNNTEKELDINDEKIKQKLIELSRNNGHEDMIQEKIKLTKWMIIFPAWYMFFKVLKKICSVFFYCCRPTHDPNFERING